MPVRSLLPLRRAATGCLLLLLLSSWAAVAVATANPAVLVLHNSFVSTEKFQRLQGFATQEGMDLRHLNVESSPPEALQTAVESAALVVTELP